VRNPWFQQDVLPALQARVQAVLTANPKETPLTDDTAAITELLHKYYDTLAWANGDRHRLWSDERRLQVR